MNRLAIHYKNGERTEKNLEKAFYWYQKAAENGDKNAMNSLAMHYENGEGTEKNLEKAFYGCQKAAGNSKVTDYMIIVKNVSNYILIINGVNNVILGDFN